MGLKQCGVCSACIFSKILGPEALRGSGGILLNEKGARFVNELTTRDKVTQSMMKNCAAVDGQHIAYIVLNDKAVETFGRNEISFYKYVFGVITEYDNADALNAALGLPVSGAA